MITWITVVVVVVVVVAVSCIGITQGELSQVSVHTGERFSLYAQP